MKYLLILLFSNLAFSQSTMDEYRWYLNPQNQSLLISIDDLHDETIVASPAMNWGRSVIASTVLKKDILIAVIDGGIDIEHPELKGKIAFNQAECFEGTVIPPNNEEDKDGNGLKGDCAGWDFVENSNRPEDSDGHGTHVTGVMNSVLSGIQGSYKFLPLKVFAADEGRSSSSSAESLTVRLIKAFKYALSRNADVIHLSVGWPKSYMTSDLEAVMKEALSKGVIVVAAAGNSSQRASIYPCQLDGVICVGALRANGDVARFSNWGNQVDVSAPGEKILSTIPFLVAPLHISRKGYDYKNGTSQAAPFVSAAMAVLKGVYPEDTIDSLYARLMLTADIPKANSSLKGLFHLDRALKIKAAPFVYPQLKGLKGIILTEDNSFSLEVPFKNHWSVKNKETLVSLSCAGAVVAATKILPAMAALQTELVTFDGLLSKDLGDLSCVLKFDTQTVGLLLKVKKNLSAAAPTVSVKQDELLVFKTRSGAVSRFMTLNTLNGSESQPIYYITALKDPKIYLKDALKGQISFGETCQFLRMWQVNLRGDKTNEIMVESLCEKSYLKYQFLDIDTREIFPAVRYKPSITNVNYSDFELILQKDLPPVLRFINLGLTIPSEDPWESNVSSKAPHLYELRPELKENIWSYQVYLLEDTDLWVKSLGLRYLPQYVVYFAVEDRLLVRLGQKTAWVDIKTQKATWAKLDDLLLMGSRRQRLIGTKEFVIQGFLTPYEYRGYTLSGIKLRFAQDDVFDPMMDILGTIKNEKGFLTILRSFQNLIYLQYDFSGTMISKKKSQVDRFDFLTAQDLIASVVNLQHNGESIQVVDGTKINTSYIDVMASGKKVSFEIPVNCVTQQPVVIDERLTLPVFCAKTKLEFEMRFIELQ
ncbi:MAG TPA: S8 family serine peptidase [Bacteriovoracaceae bacterium]|nr:S8 family serine peptidase [Bacteriovoracaceae bacterium]